mmetsp:Transcript_9287/g.11344  ORF Transcript_9287/g.11344 Transcript_9287/m.11344 type:complete len:227 (-) Transcript_9287:276-956(-)
MITLSGQHSDVLAFEGLLHQLRRSNCVDHCLIGRVLPDLVGSVVARPEDQVWQVVLHNVLEHRLISLDRDIAVVRAPLTRGNICILLRESRVSVAAEVVLAVRQRAWRVLEVDMNVRNVQGLQCGPWLRRLSHLVVQILNVVIILQLDRLCGQNIIDDGVEVDLSYDGVRAPAEGLVADAILRHQVVFHNSEHGLSELAHQHGADAEAVSQDAAQLARKRGQAEDA